MSGTDDFDWPNSDTQPEAVRTIHNGALDWIGNIEQELEPIFGGHLPSDIRAGLPVEDKPVEVRKAEAPGAAKGRTWKFDVPGTNSQAAAKRALVKDGKRRSFSFYNWNGDQATGTVYFAYTEAECTPATAFPVPIGGAVTRDFTGEVWVCTDSATDVQLRIVTEADA